MHRILPIFVLSVCVLTLVPVVLILPSIATLDSDEIDSQMNGVRHAKRSSGSLSGTAAQLTLRQMEQKQ